MTNDQGGCSLRRPVTLPPTWLATVLGAITKCKELIVLAARPWLFLEHVCPPTYIGLCYLHGLALLNRYSRLMHQLS